jgi:hypothetical protein
VPRVRELTVIRFSGPRFEDHGLDVDVLPEIIAYKRLLQETAKEVWRLTHPQRVRLPKKFEAAGVTLKFFGLEAGSTGVPLMREVPEGAPELLQLSDELDEAALLLEQSIRAAGEYQEVPARLPRDVIPLFEDLGKTLHEDEYLLIQAFASKVPARYDSRVKQRILAWASSPYSDLIDLSGEVRAMDLDGLKFTLRLADGRKIAGRFKPEHETAVLEGLGEHGSRRMRVIGHGEFSPEDGALKQILDVTSIEMVGPEAVAKGAPPIWERLASIGTNVPADTWDAVPTDLSANIDHYLYGGPKDKH